MTIEDETGFANVVFFESLFEKYRKEILQSRLIMVEGKLQIEGEVIHVIVSKCYNISGFLKSFHNRTMMKTHYSKQIISLRSNHCFTKGETFIKTVHLVYSKRLIANIQ